MKIETDPKLDFSSVLIRPKRSVLSSRNQINLKELLHSFIRIKHGLVYR